MHHRALLAALVLGASGALAGPDPSEFVVRVGWEVTHLADLSGARFMAFDDRGHLYVSRPGEGDVRAYRPDGDGYVELGAFVEDKRTVHGLCFADGWMWYAQSGAVSRARDTDGDGKADEDIVVLAEGSIPSGGGHWWRPILVAGDHFYTSIGDSGNITDQRATDRQKIWRYALDGGSRSLFASGIRNTEKLRFRPGTDEVWGFDHGSDWFGREIGDGRDSQPITDLNPGDEFNHYEEGGFYGHPFVVGRRLPRYEFIDQGGLDIHDLAERTTPPAWEMGAHWATNGWCFVDPASAGDGRALPAEYAGDAFVACHGSWNSSRRVGYCVARVDFDDDPGFGGGPVGLTKIVSTIRGGDVKARPADVVQGPDGSLFFSVDGDGGAIYRLRYVGD